MGPLPVLFALATDAAGLRLAVDGTCPAASQVRDAVRRSLGRTGATWPEGQEYSLRVRENREDMDLELFGTDGRVVLRRSFRDEAGDCAARAETVGLVVARYLESLGKPAEPALLRGKASRQRRTSRAFLGVELGVLAAGGVADPGGDTALDAGPQLGLRGGSGNLGGALRVAWILGDSFREASTTGKAGVDRIPLTLAGIISGRWGRVTLATGPRLVLEAVRSHGQTMGLRTDTSLAVKAGAEGEAAVSVFGPWVLGLSAGVDVALRRIEIQVRDPNTSDRVPLADQDLWVPWLCAFGGARWNLGR